MFTNKKPCRCVVCKTARAVTMFAAAAAAALSLSVGCGAPDDDSASDRDVDTGLEQSTEALIVSGFPDQIQTHAAQLTYSPLSWTAVNVNIGKIFCYGGRCAYSSQPMGAGASAFINANQHNFSSCSTSGTSFICNGTTYGCPVVDFHDTPTYYFKNSGWSNWSPNGSDSWPIIASDAVNASSVILQGSPGYYVLTCKYPASQSLTIGHN